MEGESEKPTPEDLLAKELQQGSEALGLPSSPGDTPKLITCDTAPSPLPKTALPPIKPPAQCL